MEDVLNPTNCATSLLVNDAKPGSYTHLVKDVFARSPVIEKDTFTLGAAYQALLTVNPNILRLLRRFADPSS